MRDRVAAGLDSQADRYHRSLSIVNGEAPPRDRSPDLEWLLLALDSHPG